MSRESILRISEAEDAAERMIADAKAQAQNMIETARKDGRALCERTEAEVSAEYAEKLKALAERAAQMQERVDAESREELTSVEAEIRLRRRSAEKIIIRGFEQKCR